MLPLKLLDRSRLGSGIAVVFAVFAAGISAPLLFVLTYHLQQELGLSPSVTSGMFAAVGAGFALGSLAAPSLTGRWGLLVPAGGVLVVVAGLAGLVVIEAAVALGHRHLAFLPVLCAAGAGQGCVTNPLFARILAGVPAAEAGAVSGLALTATQIANAIGVPAVGGVFFALLGNGTSHVFTWTLAMLMLVLTAALPLLRRLRTPWPGGPARR
ncbi:hypothetical protein [Nonomuraea ceibae]|uniref:hypothetical protein n=1 Tax=Nonomuraea ceibae TaxID=1935170 RepID=UPI001C5CD9ED|nr:hypothetical protein [Nonomuraea ceibae]